MTPENETAEVRGDINRRRFADAERKLLDVAFSARVAERISFLSIARSNSEYTDRFSLPLIRFKNFSALSHRGL